MFRGVEIYASSNKLFWHHVLYLSVNYDYLKLEHALE